MYASIGGSHQKDGIPCVSTNPLCAHMDLQFTGKSQTSKVFGMIVFERIFFGYIGSPILLGGTSTCGDHSHSSFYQKYCGVFPLLYIYRTPWAPHVACGCQRGNWQLALAQLNPGKIDSRGVGHISNPT